MTLSIQDLKLVLDTYFPVALPFQDVFIALSLLVATLPLFKLHNNQRQQPRQPRNTTWIKGIYKFFATTFSNSRNRDEHYYLGGTRVSREVVGNNFLSSVDGLLELLGIDIDDPIDIFPSVPKVLVTARVNCYRCESSNLPNQTLRRQEKA
jgi:hypothetical protein